MYKCSVFFFFIIIKELSFLMMTIMMHINKRTEYKYTVFITLIKPCDDIIIIIGGFLNKTVEPQ